MAEIWKTLPGWMRHIVVPIIVLIVAWTVFTTIVGVVGFLLGWAFKVLAIVALGAAVVILVKKASR